MIFLAILGGFMAVLGLFGLGYCIREGYRIKAQGGAPAEIHARLQRLVAVNLGSVGLAALGLGLVVAGLTLG
jgi:hypothetical protein